MGGVPPQDSLDAPPLASSVPLEFPPHRVVNSVCGTARAEQEGNKQEGAGSRSPEAALRCHPVKRMVVRRKKIKKVEEKNQIEKYKRRKPKRKIKN